MSVAFKNVYLHLKWMYFPKKHDKIGFEDRVSENTSYHQFLQYCNEKSISMLWTNEGFNQ